MVADFVASCRRHGIRPGLYASVGCNAYLGVDGNKLVGPHDPERWRAYVDMVKRQLRELWTHYGELFEIWFDGGNLPAEQGGEEISELLLELQPNAVVFQGDPERMQTVRWIGNERAVAPYPCWSTTHLGTSSDGVNEAQGERYSGCAAGRYWCPGEADMPNRDQEKAYQGGWFWQPGEDHHLYPPQELLERYYQSVGRNCNFLLGMAIDDRGLVPEADSAQMRRLSELIKDQFSRPRGRTDGSGLVFDIPNPERKTVDMVCLMEEIRHGERIQRFTVSGIDGETQVPLVSGTCVGHRFLERFPACSYPGFRLTVEEAGSTPALREFSLWQTS